MNPILIEFYFYKTLPIFPSYQWDYENYQKIYNVESFDTDFDNPVFNTFRRPFSFFFSESTDSDFYNSMAMELQDDKVKFHVEFDNVLFFYLYGSVRSYLSDFYDSLEENFGDYKTETGYKIPVYFYNERFTYLKLNPTIFEVFKFLIQTRTNFINREDDDIILNVDLVKSYEKEYAKYRFV